MRKLALAAVLLLAVPARADMFQNAGNADQPQALQNLTNQIITLSGGVLRTGAGAVAGSGYGTGSPMVWGIYPGTDGAPITAAGQQIRMVYRHAVTKDKCFDNSYDAGCISPLMINALGGAATNMVTSAATFYASTASAVGGAGINAQAINAIAASLDGSGAGAGGMGAYIVGMRYGTLGHAIGAEISAYNRSTADCGPALYASISECMGINLVARGDGIGPGLKASSVGLVLTDFAFGIWRDGIVITRDSVRDTVFNDYSLATVGLNIQGTHTYGLISTPSAGSFGFGTQTPTAIVHIAGSRSLPYSSGGMVFATSPITVTDTTSSGAAGTYNSSRFGPPTLAATNPVTYSDASTLTLGGCPVASTNVTITYCYGLKVGGDSFFQGEVVVLKAALSGTAPGASKLKVAVAAGTTAGTCKLVAYAGTSTTPTTIIDNVGAGC